MIVVTNTTAGQVVDGVLKFVREFRCNSADISSLPTEDVLTGSAALDVDTATVYLYTGTTWKKAGGE